MLLKQDYDGKQGTFLKGMCLKMEELKMKTGFRKAVVMFIDVLGSQNRENFDEWYKVMSVFSSMVRREKELDKAHPLAVYKRETHVFSDCAYIIYDYKDHVEDNKKDIYELMGIACYNTEKVIYEFLKNGFIVRGSITYGDLFYDNENNIWFGPAMNRAYYLEAKQARFPRIIVDPQYAEKLYEFNESKYRNNPEKKSTNGKILWKDIDGLFYLNYLNSIKQGLNHIEGEYIIENTLKLCERERNIKRDTKELQESVKEKYDWLEKYILS